MLVSRKSHHQMLKLVAEAFMGIGYLYSSNTSRYKIIKIFATKKIGSSQWRNMADIILTKISKLT